MSVGDRESGWADRERPVGGGDSAASSGIVTVWMTAPGAEVAERLAREAVGERLAACANIVPGITSVYWWEGKLESEDEVLVVFKTTEDKVGSLMERVVKSHPYDVPEFLSFPVGSGHRPYLEWVREAVSGGSDG